MTIEVQINIITTIIVLGYIAYNYWIYKKYGMLPSVSASFQKLKKENKGGWFRAFIIGLMLCSWLLSIIVFSWAFAVAGMGSLYVYVAAEYYKDKITETIHIIGASTLIVSYLLGIILLNPTNWLNYIPASIMLILLIIGLIKRVLFKKGKVDKEDLFDYAGLWYEHISVAVICAGLYILI